MDKLCIDCGKKLYSGNKTGRCVPCMNRHRASDPEFKRAISEGRRAAIADPNYMKNKHSRYCIDCGVLLRGHGSPLRCRSCSSKVVMVDLAEQGRLGTPCTEERKQRISEGMKAAHERGCYDDWMEEFAEIGKIIWKDPVRIQEAAERASAQMSRGFQHPSSLELLVQDFFDTHNIAYVPQYKPDNYNRVYDFLLPDAMPPLLVEVDGHYWHASEDAIARGAAETDAAKDTWANANGFDILRIPERDMLAVGVEAFILDTRPEIVMEFF